MQTSLTIDQILREFLSNQDINQRSHKTYEYALKSYFRWNTANRKDNRCLTYPDLLQYKEYLLSNKKLTTACSYLTIIKKFWSWCETKNYSLNIARLIKLPKRYKGFKKRPLTVEQVATLFNSVDIKTIQGKRDIAILHLLAARGIRLIEVSRMNVADIFQVNTDICLRLQRKGKKEKDDFIVITGAINELIQNYLDQRPELEMDSPMFISHSRFNDGQRLTAQGLSAIVKEYLEKANIKQTDITAHSLRHTAAVTLITNGFGIYEAAKLLGHSKTEITELYTKYADESIKLTNKAGKFLDKIYSKNQFSEALAELS